MHCTALLKCRGGKQPAAGLSEEQQEEPAAAEQPEGQQEPQTAAKAPARRLPATTPHTAAAKQGDAAAGAQHTAKAAPGPKPPRAAAATPAPLRSGLNAAEIALLAGGGWLVR